VIAVVAPTAPGRAQTDEGATIALEPVTVTARTGEEDIRQVPFGITAVTRAELDAGQIRSTETLARTVPNFNFTNSGLPFANLLNIRGIGSSSAIIAPSVTYYVDGIPVPTRVFDQRFLDVSRIEVLRGPQGTLFGLNAQAGAVSITTVVPGPVVSGEVGTEFGSFGRRLLTGAIGGPLTDTVSARIAGQLYGQDGDIRNVLFAPGGGLAGTEREARSEVLGAVWGKALTAVGHDEDAAATVLARIAARWHPISRPRRDALLAQAGFGPSQPFFRALAFGGWISLRR